MSWSRPVTIHWQPFLQSLASPKEERAACKNLDRRAICKAFANAMSQKGIDTQAVIVAISRFRLRIKKGGYPSFSSLRPLCRFGRTPAVIRCLIKREDLVAPLNPRFLKFSYCIWERGRSNSESVRRVIERTLQLYLARIGTVRNTETKELAVLRERLIL